MVIPYCNFLRTLRFASLSIFPQRIKTTALWSFCLEFSVVFKCSKGNSIAPLVLSCRYGNSQCCLIHHFILVIFMIFFVPKVMNVVGDI